MSHTIIYNSAERIIEVTIRGDFSLQEAKEIIITGIPIVKEQNCFLVLTDLRAATLKLSTMELYEFPKMMDAMLASSGLNVYKWKRALVAKKDLKDYLFFETVTVNRGQTIKYFFDIDQARQWLSEK